MEDNTFLAANVLEKLALEDCTESVQDTPYDLIQYTHRCFLCPSTKIAVKHKFGNQSSSEPNCLTALFPCWNDTLIIHLLLKSRVNQYFDMFYLSYISAPHHHSSTSSQRSVTLRPPQLPSSTTVLIFRRLHSL